MKPSKSSMISHSSSCNCVSDFKTSVNLSKVKKLLLIVFIFFLYALLIPILLVILSPLYLYRFFVISIAKLFKPELKGIVCTRDAVVGLDDVTKRSQCVLNTMLTYRGEPDLEHIRNVFQQKVMDSMDTNGNQLYAKFTYYYESWMGYAFWKKENEFKLENHIRFCEETEASIHENSINEESLMTILGPICTKPFKKEVSPWEIIIVRNFIPASNKINREFKPNTEVGGDEEKNKFALIIRIHHCIADGFSIMKLIMRNFSDVPLSKILPPQLEEKSILEMFMLYIGIIILSPYYHVKQFVLDVDKNFWHLKESQLTGELFTIRSEVISVDDLKQASKRLKVSATAVLLTTFGGAIRNFLKNTGKENMMPKLIRGFASMPWKNHPMDGLINHWTMGVTVFPIGISCLKERLKVANDSVLLLKTSPILFTNFGTVPFFLGPPSWLTDTWGANWMTTAMSSNFAGANFCLKSFGQYYLEDSTFWLPLLRGTSSLGVTFLSYNGGIRATVTIDKSIIKSQHQADLLSQFINQEFKNLLSIGQDDNV